MGDEVLLSTAAKIVSSLSKPLILFPKDTKASSIEEFISSEKIS